MTRIDALLEALDGQFQATFAAALAQIQQKLAARPRRIEARLGLPPEAIGRKHQVVDGAVVPVAGNGS